MKLPRRLLPFVAAGLVVGAISLVAAAPTGGRTPAQVEKTQQRIDSMLKNRLKPEPLPLTLPNPFQVVGGTATLSEGSAPPTDATTETPVPEVVTDSTTEALARYVGKLKIGGYIRINNQPQLFVNDAPRKEGDFIIVEQKDSAIYLQIVQITTSNVTFRLNEATLTVKF